MATITKEEEKLDTLYEKTGLLRDDSTHFMAKDVSSMKNDNIPFKFRSELSTNIFLNQVYCGMKVCDKLGINYEDAVNKPWMLTKEVLKSDIVFTGFQDKTVPQTKAGVLSTIMGINMQNANPYISFDNLAMVSKGLETFNICANNREKASVASDISSLAMPLANFMDRNYSGEIARNKEELYKKLILIDKENPSLIELTAFGEINPLTGEKGNCCPNSRDMECKDVFVRATEMFNDFATYEAGLANQPLLSNKNVISPKEFIKATIDLACREYNELKTTMPTPSQSQEMIDSRMQAIKETLKDPTAGFMASIDIIASINLGDSAIKNDRLKELSDYCKAFKEGDTKLEIDGYAQTQLAKEQKTLTMDLYFKANKNFDSENLKKPLIKAEDELVKSNKSFNSDVKKLMSASEKLTKSRMEATKAGKKDKANESFKKLTVLDKKIGELQDKELNNLEKAYLDGKMPDEYFKARVVQIMSLNTKDVPTFPSALGKNVTKISTFINGTFTNKPALEQRTKFPEFYKNIVTPSGKVHGNDAPKINAEKAKAVEVAKPAEAKQEAKSVNTAPPAMGK